MYKVAVLLALVAVAYGQVGPAQVCRLSSLTTTVNFQPSLWQGAWFEQYFFPRKDYNLQDVYEDFTYEVTPQGLDMQVVEQIRQRPGSQCSTTNNALRKWEADGKYFLYKSQAAQNVRSWILDTDYNTYAVEFLCYDVRGDTCYDSEVSLWTRLPNYVPHKQLVYDRFNRIFGRQAVCNNGQGFRFNRRMEIKQNYIATYDPRININYFAYNNAAAYGSGGCTSLPLYSIQYQSGVLPGLYFNVPGTTVPGTTVPGVTYPGVTYPGVTYPGMTYPNMVYPGMTYPATTYPYNYNMYGLGHMIGQVISPELVQPKKEQLVAEKDKFVTEKEMLQLEIEKLRLENDILRRGGSI